MAAIWHVWPESYRYTSAKDRGRNPLRHVAKPEPHDVVQHADEQCASKLTPALVRRHILIGAGVLAATARGSTNRMSMPA